MELSKKTILRVFLGVAGCIVLYWALHETSSLVSAVQAVLNVLSPFIIGASLAFVLNVPMRAIESLLKKITSRGLRRALALLVTLLLVILVLFGVFCLVIPQVVDTVQSLVSQLPAFLSSAQSKITAFLQEHPQIQSIVGNYSDMDWGAMLQGAAGSITESLGIFANQAFGFVVGLGTGVFNAFLSIVFAIYCLIRKEILARQGRRILYSILPEQACDKIIRILRMTNYTFSRFISGQCLEAVILASMFAVSMSIFQMPFMPLISVIICITALIPIVGAFAGCIIGALFILVVDPVLAFWFVVLFLVLQQIEGNLIYPKVVGSSVGLPGMWVLLAVAIGGSMMGVGGMLLMIPLSSVCYCLAREFTDKRLAERAIPSEKLQDQPMIRDDEKPGRRKKNNKTSR